MSQIASMLAPSFTTICLAVGFAIVVTTNRNLDDHTNRCFLLFAVVVIVLVFVDTVDNYLADLATPTVLRYLTSTMGYTLRPAALVIFIDILMRRRKSNLVLWGLIVVVGIVAFTSYFTHAMFWFNDLGTFMRGPLSYLSHIVSGIYLILLVTLMIKMHRYITPGEIFIVLFLAFICILATALESLSVQKFLLTGAMMTSCVLYYIVLYIDTYKRDPLTGLLNRRSFFTDAKRMHEKTLAVISLDMNGLKELNDSHGHNAGDKALQNIAAAMLVKSGNPFIAYRVGGDEFMALGEGIATEAVETYIDDMRADLRAKDLMASFGYAFYYPGDNFEDVCNQADSRMYEDKRRFKHRG